MKYPIGTKLLDNVSQYTYIITKVISEGIYAIQREGEYEHREVMTDYQLDKLITIPKAKEKTSNRPVTTESETALRYNSDKPQLSLLPKEGLAAAAKVLEKGAVKYGRNNWRKLWGDETVNVCVDSAMRHMLEMSSGNMNDNETGEYHAAHIICNMLFIIEHLAQKDKK